MSDEIKYNSAAVNLKVEDIIAASQRFDSVATSLEEATSAIVSAKGFGYIGGLSSDQYSANINECKSACLFMTDSIRRTQLSLLKYYNSDAEIEAFLNSISDAEWNRMGLGDYPKDYNGIGAILAATAGAEGGLESLGFDYEASFGTKAKTFGLGLFEGVLDFFETAADSVVIGFGTISAGLSWITGGKDAFNKKMEATRAYVEDSWSKSLVDGIIEKDDDLREFRNLSPQQFGATRAIGKGIGYAATLIGTTVLTAGAGGLAGGAGFKAGMAGATKMMPAVAGVLGFGSGTEEAWNNGASTAGGLTQGVATGAWEALQWQAGISLNSATQGLNLAGRTLINAGVDGVFGGLEGFVRPGIQTIGTDMTFEQAFEQAGGWQNVKNGATVSALMSGGAEIGGDVAGAISKNVKGFFGNADISTNGIAGEREQ